MSDATIIETPAETTAPKTNGKPKSAPKKAPKPVAKKTPTKKPAKTAPVRAERAKKEGLRDPQVRILKVLAKARAPMDRTKINEGCAAGGFATAEKFTQWMADPLGSPNPETRVAAEERSGYPSLLTLKYVKMVTVTILEKPTKCYEITPAGRKALEAALVAAKEAAKAKK